MSSIGSGLTGSNGTQLIAGASYTNGDGINVSQTVDAILQADAAPETAWQNDVDSADQPRKAGIADGIFVPAELVPKLERF